MNRTSVINTTKRGDAEQHIHFSPFADKTWVESTFPKTEWLKLTIAETVFGISRPEIFRTVIRNDVVGVHLVKPGKKKRIWLVNKASIEDNIRSFLPGGSRHQKQFVEAK